MGIIQEFYSEHFKNFKIRFTQTQVKDVTDETEQEEIMINEHKRAHRNSRENREQIKRKFYFPKMAEKTDRIAKTCRTCKEQKYDRQPNKPKLQPTPIPRNPGEIIHIDIYSTEGHLVLTAIDKYSKYVQAKILKSRAIEDIKEPLKELILAYGIPKLIVIDNEKSLNSASITFILKNQFGINIFTTPPYSSTVNGQIERLHSTLAEIMRCLKPDKLHNSFHDLLIRAICEYNSSIHSTTKCKPVDIFFNRNNDPQKALIEKEEIINRLTEKQKQDLEYHNKNRQEPKTYSVGQKIFVKINKRLGSKLSARYREETVKEDKNTTVLTMSGRIVHKNNIRK
uniref:RNA-directed DNA polymerase n=1 Tax=Ceratitis capitata TaxID=7213 RepID=W8ABC9_CERCA